MTQPITGGAAAIRHHRAKLTAQLDRIEQRTAHLAQKHARLGRRADLLRAAIAADTNALTQLTRAATTKTTTATPTPAANPAQPPPTGQPEHA